MHTKETANVSYRKLAALQKLHISRRKRNLLKVHLSGQTNYALTILKTTIYVFGCLLQFLVLILAKPGCSLIVAYDTPNIAAIGKSFKRLPVSG